MVWRRRDEPDARLRVTQPRNHLVDLVARQLAALAGLGALRDLDLDDLGVDEILRRDAEATRCDLLDLRDALRPVTRRILATFTGIRTRADTVHRDSQRLVRLRRQRAQRHPGAVEAHQYVLDGLDLIQRHGRARRLQRHQVAQRRNRPVVDERRILFVPLHIAAAHRRLQRHDDVRVVTVVFAAVDVFQQAALRDRHPRIPRRRRELALIGEQVIEVGALNTRRRARKAA